MRYPQSLVIVAAAAIAAVFFGCAAKPGTALAINEETPVTLNEPTGTHSAAVIGQLTTTTSGPLAVETSKLTDDGLWETNAGGAAKQRGAFTIGRLRGLLSGASDLDIAGVEIVFGPEGDPSTMKIAKIGTSNSAVQRAVNEGIVALVTQWQRASDNEKAVLLAQIEAQAKLGDAAAKGAVEIIKSFVLPTP